ncbi:hypothetical protein F2P81_009188 [Scophthalmus maximus]|uniref:Uncharacterized protein n=1 Tax=Scophthalmus maximus TaxID=52904 RepID=A0A6A4T6B5_SCOMX|nr:hypothetical protein F2P81_009188 [Scophthalmus maximus]
MSWSKVKRKVDDEHRLFQEKLEMDSVFVEFRGTFLICKEKIAVLKEYKFLLLLLDCELLLMLRNNWEQKGHFASMKITYLTHGCAVRVCVWIPVMCGAHRQCKPNQCLSLLYEFAVEAVGDGAERNVGNASKASCILRSHC